MIVIGTDTHKATHTCGAVFADSGQFVGKLATPAREPGFRQLLAWGRSLDRSASGRSRTGCRHVSGSFERFLVASGERVVRVPPKLMGESRRGERTRGKSDPIGALAVARAALREGPETLPGAHLGEAALELELPLDHRGAPVKARSEDQQRLRWHLHDLWPELEIPAGALDRIVWLDRVARRLSRARRSAKARIARELVVEIRRRTSRAAELEREIGALVRTHVPQLLDLPGCGTLTAAKVLAETAGAARFSSDAKLARLAGVARSQPPRATASATASIAVAIAQLNCALHRIAVTQGRVHPPAREFLARKQAEGKSRWRRCAASSATWRAGYGGYWSVLKGIYP